MNTVPDQIQKTVALPVPISRVWAALTDYQEFGEWFMAAPGAPFIPGLPTTGRIICPGCEHLKWEATILDLVPESYFSFSWHPYAMDEENDYSQEAPTRVSFELTPIDGGGCSLIICESGFDQIPAARREEAYLMNAGGWTIQAENLRRYLQENP
ncbi:MAG: SRPBCC family protein [Luteolibacter sp.]